MNKGIFVGNLGGDPQIKQEGQNTKCFFSIAVNEKVGKEKRTTWVKCHISGKPATSIATYFRKGDCICVEGRLWANINQTQNGPRAELHLLVQGWSFAGGSKPQQSAGQYTSPANQGQQYGSQGYTQRTNQQQYPQNVPTQQYAQPSGGYPDATPSGGYQQGPPLAPHPVQQPQPVQQPNLYSGEPIGDANAGGFFNS